MASPHPGSPYYPPAAAQNEPDSNPAAATPTPPPPPPKAGHTHTTSLTGPPLPPHPEQHIAVSNAIDASRRYSQPPSSPHHPDRFSQHQSIQTQQNPEQVQYAYRNDTQASLPPEGWLPPGLTDKPKQQLQSLLATPSLLNALLHAPSTAHASLKASTQPIKQLVTANTALATELVSLEATIASRRDHAQQHLLSVRALEQQWRKKQVDLETRLEAFGPRVLHQRLAQGIVEQDAICRSLEESFMEGDGLATEREVGEWVRRVREARKVAGLRRERKSRWDEGRVGGWR